MVKIFAWKDGVEFQTSELEKSVRKMENNVIQLEAGNLEADDSGPKYLGFFYSRFLKTREKYISFGQFLLSLYILWGKFLNDEIHNYVKKTIIVNFIIQKLKSKHTSLKKYTNWAKLIHFSFFLREWEEKKPNISHLW